ncbi:MAG: hypothetical protein H6739_13670 [Alphaproteobacteria bacterium]|nr:hypothetical protein [Alphaproteobacteria bacterium]
MTVSLNERPEALWDPSVPLTELRALGICVGYPSALVPAAWLKPANHWGDGPPPQVPEPPPDGHYWLTFPSTGEVAGLWLAEGLVRQLRLVREGMARFGSLTEETLRGALGPPDDVSRSIGHLTLRWTGRGLAVTWDGRTGALVCVDLDADPQPPRLYRARDLLEEVFDFLSWAPKPADWSEAALKARPPARVRFLRVRALSRAFGVWSEATPDPGLPPNRQPPHPISALQFGDFLKGREGCPPLDEAIATYIEAREPRGRHTPFGPRIGFMYLFGFVQKARALRRHNSGVLEAGAVELRWAMHEVAQAVAPLEEPVEALAALLARAIDPAERGFTLVELEQRFGYPADDLHEIDMDWM